MQEIKFSPLDVERDKDQYIGEFWLNSGAFIFPVQGWRDDVPARLVELAVAFTQAENDGKPSTVTFRDGQHRMLVQRDPVDLTRFRITYADRLEGGLLYREKLVKRDLQAEIARGMKLMLEVCVRRHWSTPASALNEAMDLPGMRRRF